MLKVTKHNKRKQTIRLRLYLSSTLSCDLNDLVDLEITLC